MQDHALIAIGQHRFVSKLTACASIHTSAALPSRPSWQASAKRYFNSKAARERREQEQQGQRTRRRPATATPHFSSSSDRDRLRLLRRLPSPPQVDSGSHSLNSSTGDLVQDPDFPSQGDLLIQRFSEATKFGEESAKKLKQRMLSCSKKIKNSDK